MASPMRAFDPLIDFAGMWNYKLAGRYLPLPELPRARTCSHPEISRSGCGHASHRAEEPFDMSFDPRELLG
jgi:hypothetical protein